MRERERKGCNCEREERGVHLLPDYCFAEHNLNLDVVLTFRIIKSFENCIGVSIRNL
jgi:hypothetical protein